MVSTEDERSPAQDEIRGRSPENAALERHLSSRSRCYVESGMKKAAGDYSSRDSLASWRWSGRHVGAGFLAALVSTGLSMWPDTVVSGQTFQLMLRADYWRWALLYNPFVAVVLVGLVTLILSHPADSPLDVGHRTDWQIMTGAAIGIGGAAVATWFRFETGRRGERLVVIEQQDFWEWLLLSVPLCSLLASLPITAAVRAKIETRRQVEEAERIQATRLEEAEQAAASLRRQLDREAEEREDLESERLQTHIAEVKKENERSQGRHGAKENDEWLRRREALDGMRLRGMLTEAEYRQAVTNLEETD